MWNSWLCGQRCLPTDDGLCWIGGKRTVKSDQGLYIQVKLWYLVQGIIFSEFDWSHRGFKSVTSHEKKNPNTVVRNFFYRGKKILLYIVKSRKNESIRVRDFFYKCTEENKNLIHEVESRKQCVNPPPPFPLLWTLFYCHKNGNATDRSTIHSSIKSNLSETPDLREGGLAYVDIHCTSIRNWHLWMLLS